MSEPPHRWTAVLLLFFLLGALTACAPGDARTTASVTRGIPTGPGVTPNTITLGILTDLTGPDAELGKNVTRGNQLFWQDQNEKDGVCGRSVVLIIKDHAGDVQSATAQYAALAPHVLALQQLLGASITAALGSSIERDAALTVAVSSSSRLLRDPHVVVTGTTYDLQMIDGIDWLMKNRGLRAGETIGDVHLDDEYGEDSALGVAAAATAYGLKVVSETVSAATADVGAQVRRISASGAHVVALSTTPAQAASAMGSARSAGFDATFIAPSPTFAPSLVEGPEKTPASTRLVITQSYAPFSGDSPGASRFRTEYSAAYPHESPNAAADYGYGQGEVMYQLLKASCASGSLQRAAVARSVPMVRHLDSEGLLGPLDYSTPGQPPGRAVYILQPDATVPGDLRVVEPLVASPLALTYRCPC